MATHAITKYNLIVFWDDEFKKLNYVHEKFNDPAQVQAWQKQFSVKWNSTDFTGEMCDMRQPQPSWNQKFIDLFTMLGWKDIGTSYYRMMPGTVLPTHSDTYKKYIELFDLKNKEHTIRRALVLLEDWKSGHYLEAMNQPVVGWSAGTVVEWTYNTPHIAGNIGEEPRYTLQITGHIDD